MSSRGEYIDFKFGNHWASDFDFYKISINDRHSVVMYGNFDSNTMSVIGKKGLYKWETQYNEKTIPVSLAFDNLNVSDINEIKKWLSPDRVQKLYLSEEPYKFYYVCVSSDPEFNFVPFKTNQILVGDKYIQQAVYKGEIELEFLCIDNNGYSDYDNYEKLIQTWGEELDSKIEIIEASSTGRQLYTGEDYYTIAAKMENVVGTPKSYIFKEGDGYAFISESQLNEDKKEGIENFLIDKGLNPEEYYTILPSTLEDINDYFIYQIPIENFNLIPVIEKVNSSTNIIEPWVFNSNLLNDSPIYNSNQIYLRSFLEQDSGDSSTSGISASRPIYLINSGTEDANLSISFDLIKILPDQDLVIQINQAQLSSSGWFIGELVSEFRLSSFENYKPFLDFIGEDFNRDNFQIVIDSNLCEVFLVNKETSEKINLNIFNKTQDFLTLRNCNFVNYLKPFPTSLTEVNDTALEETYFNRVKIADGLPYRLKNINLEWKHTYK